MNGYRDNYINCIAHPSSEGNLLIGREKTALFDCGMLFCADETIENVRKALRHRPLDYIFATHTHYDHIGALPAFRKVWPDVKLVTCEAGANVLQKDTPRKLFRDLAAEAGHFYGQPVTPELLDYPDDSIRADVTVSENDEISLGNYTVQVVATPGHTRDALSYFVVESGLLVTSETTGILLWDECDYPAYLTGYGDAVASIEKCRSLPWKTLSLPHRGVIPDGLADGFFDKSHRDLVACHDMIAKLYKSGASEDDMVAAFEAKYWNETMAKYQPKEAFLLNARATVACTVREITL